MNLTKTQKSTTYRLHQTTGMYAKPRRSSADRISQRAWVLCGALADGDWIDWKTRTGNIREHVLPFIADATGQSCGCDVVALYSGCAPLSGAFEGFEYALASFGDYFRPDLGRALSKLTTLRDLPDDWDGAGAVKISDAAHHRAVDMVSNALNMGRLPDFVAPLPDGGLQLEWGPLNNKKLVVAIDPDGTDIEFVFIDERGAAAAEDGTVLQDSDLDRFLKVMR